MRLTPQKCHDKNGSGNRLDTPRVMHSKRVTRAPALNKVSVLHTTCPQTLPNEESMDAVLAQALTRLDGALGVEARAVDVDMNLSGL
jgi:hypothetical protein